jgi:hypothetical protein
MTTEDILTTFVIVLILLWTITRILSNIVIPFNFNPNIFVKMKDKVSGLSQKLQSADIYKVKKPNWYGYHLLVYGSTGKGKSTFVEYALSQILTSLPAATFIVINPHHRKKQWGLIDNVIGAGRAYDEIADAFNNLLEILNKRYQTYYEDCDATFNDLFIIIDELPAINANTEKNTVPNALKQISSEARKVNMWLVIISQSKLVKQLGFERASDMLENFVFIEVKKPVVYYKIDDEEIEEKFNLVKVDLSNNVEKSKTEEKGENLCNSDGND